jgi:hypothetical protein
LCAEGYTAFSQLLPAVTFQPFSVAVMFHCFYQCGKEFLENDHAVVEKE